MCASCRTGGPKSCWRNVSTTFSLILHSSQWLLNKLRCPSMVVWMRNVPHRLLYLNIGAVWGGYGAFRGWSLYEGSTPYGQLWEFMDFSDFHLTFFYFLPVVEYVISQILALAIYCHPSATIWTLLLEAYTKVNSVFFFPECLLVLVFVIATKSNLMHNAYPND